MKNAEMLKIASAQPGKSDPLALARILGLSGAVSGGIIGSRRIFGSTARNAATGALTGGVLGGGIGGLMDIIRESDSGKSIRRGPGPLAFTKLLGAAGAAHGAIAPSPAVEGSRVSRVVRRTSNKQLRPRAEQALSHGLYGLAAGGILDMVRAARRSGR